jgi:hypothetical protein
MVFDLQTFLASPDVSVLRQLKKAELFQFVEHFSLDVKQSARKLEMQLYCI